MIIDYVYIKCPNCKKETIADLHDCNCIFSNCEHCGTDIEICKNCKNTKEN